MFVKNVKRATDPFFLDNGLVILYGHTINLTGKAIIRMVDLKAFVSVKPNRVSQQVAEQIKDLILGGEIETRR